jgi:hypothetical protein
LGMERTHHNRNENSCWLQRTTVSPIIYW